MAKDRIYAVYETNTNETRLLKGRRETGGHGRFKGFEGGVSLDHSLARIHKGKPVFRIKEGSAVCLPWSGDSEVSPITPERYDEALGNNYVQQVMERLRPQTLDSVRNWIMFAAVLGIIVFQFWLYNETQKDLKEMTALLHALHPATGAGAGSTTTTVGG